MPAPRRVGEWEEVTPELSLKGLGGEGNGGRE